MTTREEIVAKLLQSETNEHGSVRPPWVRLPGVHPFHIAWRMGAGEAHLMLWSAWCCDHDATGRMDVIKRYGPVPADWAWWAAEASELVTEDDPYEIAFDEVRRRLESVGIVVVGEPEK